MPLLVSEFDPYHTWYLWAYTSQHPNRLTRGSSVFAQYAGVPNTQTQRATSVATARIYAMRAMRPKLT